jgi:hypothetical protein
VILILSEQNDEPNMSQQEELKVNTASLDPSLLQSPATYRVVDVPPLRIDSIEMATSPTNMLIKEKSSRREEQIVVPPTVNQANQAFPVLSL